MVDQTRAAGQIAERLGSQLMEARDLAERDGALANLRDSQQAQHTRDTIDEERLQERIEAAQENQRIRDQVHISERAQALYRAREAELDGAPERAHARRQETGNQEPEQTALGNMDPSHQ